MCGWFGVSGWRSVRRSIARGAWAALALGCTGESLLVGEELPTDRIDADSLLDGGVDAGPPVVAVPQGCPASPAERQTVLGCWPPTRHLGRFRGYFIGTPLYERLDGSGEQFPAGGVALELAVDGSGLLTFGSGGPLADREPCAGVNTTRCASIGHLLSGFAYQLEDIALFDPKDEPPRIFGEPPLHIAESMSFVAWLGQPWEAWCADQTVPKSACPSGECADAPSEYLPPPGLAGSENDGSSACRCGEAACRPSATSLSITLRMSPDGKALRGFYKPLDRGLGEPRLELEREP